MGAYGDMWREIRWQRRIDRWGLRPLLSFLFFSFVYERTILAILATWAFVFWFGSISAHDAAQWIQDGNYKNAAGELCCGKKDCEELPDSRVKVVPQGYRVLLTHPSPLGTALYYEIVPFDEVTPSPDGKYWRCQWGGDRKCFFAPPGSS